MFTLTSKEYNPLGDTEYITMTFPDDGDFTCDCGRIEHDFVLCDICWSKGVHTKLCEHCFEYIRKEYGIVDENVCFDCADEGLHRIADDITSSPHEGPDSSPAPQLLRNDHE